MKFVHRRNCKDTKRTRQPSEYLALLFLSNTSREGCGITDKVCTIPAVFYPCLPHPSRKKAHKSPFLLNRSLYHTTFKSQCQGGIFSFTCLSVKARPINVREAPVRIAFLTGASSFVTPVSVMRSIAQHISNFKTRTSRNIPADTDRPCADLPDVDGQSVKCGHALLVDDLCVSS